MLRKKPVFLGPSFVCNMYGDLKTTELQKNIFYTLTETTVIPRRPNELAYFFYIYLYYI